MPSELTTLKERKAYADELMGVYQQRMSDLAAQVASGDISIGSWQIEMRAELRNMNAMMLITAAGGNKDEVESADWLKLGSELKSQYDYLEDFAHYIAENPDMSEAAIAARAGLYAKSTMATFWRQTADGMGIDLPAHPGDGDSECLTNCQCEWSFEDVPDDDNNVVAVDATWNLNDGSHHCPTCEENSRKWNPIRLTVNE